MFSLVISFNLTEKKLLGEFAAKKNLPLNVRQSCFIGINFLEWHSVRNLDGFITPNLHKNLKNAVHLGTVINICVTFDNSNLCKGLTPFMIIRPVLLLLFFDCYSTALCPCGMRQNP